MTTAIAKRMCQQTHGDGHSKEATLPCILDRLSRLENEGFSYDELLHDFASRRRVGPVSEDLPARHVIDPAEETDEIVQAYLSLTREACSAWSTKWASSCSGPRERLALCGLSAIKGHDGTARKTRTQPAHSSSSTSRAQQQKLESGSAVREYIGQDDDAGIKHFVRPVVRDGRIGFLEGDGCGSGGHKAHPTPEVLQRPGRSRDTLERHAEALEVHTLASSSPHDRGGFKRSSSGSSTWCSTQSPRAQGALDYYPSRPISAGEAVAVSLISPRTSKRIGYLPRPAESELENLQRLEHATRNFSAKELQRNKLGGLYSTIGRTKVGLIETDIDDLTATATSRKEVLAATNSAAVTKSLANHGGGILAGLLGQKTTATLPTVNPACFRGPLGFTTEASGSPKRPRSSHHAAGQRSKRGGSSGARIFAPPAPAPVPAATRTGGHQGGLEGSERLTVLGADGNQHCENLADNMRRLRALLGESMSQGEVRRAGTPSLFSVRELRAIGVRGRAPAGDQDTQEVGVDPAGVRQPPGSQEAKPPPGGAAVELAVGGNVLLRKLAKALFSSMQSRIQNEFLVLGFRKWKVVLEERAVTGYLEATLLIQSILRRRLAVKEMSERRRLMDIQTRQEQNTLELAVERRQASALKLQPWIRGEMGRRRAREMCCLLQAARMVQKAARRKIARARARRWRKEQRRVREAEAKEEQRERELREKLRREVAIKVEALAKHEALLAQRYHDLQERFRREGAATRIQACWRSRVLKRNLSALVRIGKRTRAIRIQRFVRGFLAKRELQRRREAFKIRFASEIAASIKVQTIVRRRIAWNRAEERRFQRSKEELVSTMDAERALRIQRIEVPKIRALAVREGPILFSEGKGQPYVIDPVALKVNLAERRRAINPWQGSTDRKAATKIQALFRGHRQAVRIRRLRVQRRREGAENRRIREFKAANDLQRVFRGKRSRVEAKSRRYGLRAVRVQKVWRGFLGKRLAADKRQRVQAAIVLQRRLRVAQARALAARMRLEAVTASAPALAIQSAARRYLARRRYRRLVRDKQVEWEWSTMAAEMGRFCAERARLRVIVEGAAAPNCKGDGVTQFIFRKIAVKRSSGGEGSGYFRLEGRAFNKLIANTPGVFNSSFRATDVDLVFARVKDKDEKTLTYEQFASALNVVATAIFPDIKRFQDFRAFKAKAARLLELVEGKVLKAPGAAEYRKFCQKAGERFLYRSVCRIQATVRGHMGRRRFKLKRLESEEVARIELESSEVVKLQALGRRYCARCRAIRLAQAQISKYIDPTKKLPYWVNPATGVTTWSKPKVFGAADVEHAMMVTTSKTEHLVKCSVCDTNPVQRMCTSCRDSYCKDCFQALHGKGKRRNHVAPTVHMCCVCNYQHATRVCETCTFKTSSTRAYCDVCFFNRHPGLDVLSKAEAAIAGGEGGQGAKAWAISGAQKQDGWNHRWTPLVVICVECRRYAARWLCDDCEEVYCVGCYASVHRHGSKVKHGAEKLPYYPVDLHMEYAMACRKRSRKERDDEARAVWLEEQARAKEAAAIKIQARWRGRVGRIEGRAYLKAGRAGHREAWRQRKRDDRKRKALWYEALDLAGLAPQLASDRVDEQALKRVPRMGRTRPRKYIALNREDDAWVPGKLDGRKGIIRRGFDFGEIGELKDQAKRGGVRLPGAHLATTGHRCIYTDPAYNMGDFLKPKNVIRVHGELFNVEAVEADRIRVDRVWHKRDAKRVLLYKMVLNPRQKLVLRASKNFWSSQAVQYGIQVNLVLKEDLVNRLLRKAAKHYKRKRNKRLYTLAKRTLKRSEENIKSLKFKLNTAQFGLDNSLVNGEAHADEKEADPASVQESAESALAWVEIMDEETGRPTWRNTVTGEVTISPPKGMKNIQKMTADMEKQKEMMRAKKAKKR